MILPWPVCSGLGVRFQGVPGSSHTSWAGLQGSRQHVSSRWAFSRRRLSHWHQEKQGLIHVPVRTAPIDAAPGEAPVLLSQTADDTGLEASAHTVAASSIDKHQPHYEDQQQRNATPIGASSNISSSGSSSDNGDSPMPLPEQHDHHQLWHQSELRLMEDHQALASQAGGTGHWQPPSSSEGLLHAERLASHAAASTSGPGIGPSSSSHGRLSGSATSSLSGPATSSRNASSSVAQRPDAASVGASNPTAAADAGAPSLRVPSGLPKAGAAQAGFVSGDGDDSKGRSQHAAAAAGPGTSPAPAAQLAELTERLHTAATLRLLVRPAETCSSGAPACTPAKLASLAATLHLPVGAAQRLAVRCPLLVAVDGYLLDRSVSELSAALSLPRRQAAFMFCKQPAHLLSTPASDVATRVRELARRLRVPFSDAAAWAALAPSVTKRDPVVMAARVAALSDLLGRPPPRRLLAAIAEEPELLTRSVPALARRLAALRAVLKVRDVAAQRAAAARPGVLLMSPRVLVNKVRVLMAILNKDRHAVGLLVAKCPELLRSDLTAVRAAYGALQRLLGRPERYVYAMLCHSPRLLVARPEGVVARVARLRAATSRCDEWAAEWARLRPAETDECVKRGWGAYQRLEYLLASGQAPGSCLAATLRAKRADFDARCPEYSAWRRERLAQLRAARQQQQARVAAQLARQVPADAWGPILQQQARRRGGQQHQAGAAGRPAGMGRLVEAGPGPTVKLPARAAWAAAEAVAVAAGPVVPSWHPSNGSNSGTTTSSGSRSSSSSTSSSSARRWEGGGVVVRSSSSPSGAVPGASSSLGSSVVDVSGGEATALTQQRRGLPHQQQQWAWEQRDQAHQPEAQLQLQLQQQQQQQQQPWGQATFVQADGAPEPGLPMLADHVSADHGGSSSSINSSGGCSGSSGSSEGGNSSSSSSSSWHEALGNCGASGDVTAAAAYGQGDVNGWHNGSVVAAMNGDGQKRLHHPTRRRQQQQQQQQRRRRQGNNDTASAPRRNTGAFEEELVLQQQ